jgi:hypothetical protein
MLFQHEPSGRTVAEPYESLGHKQYAAPDDPARQQRHSHYHSHIHPLLDTLRPVESKVIKQTVDMSQKPLRGLMGGNDVSQHSKVNLIILLKLTHYQHSGYHKSSDARR